MSKYTVTRPQGGNKQKYVRVDRALIAKADTLALLSGMSRQHALGGIILFLMGLSEPTDPSGVRTTEGGES